MNKPEKIAATLAIHALDVMRQNPIRAFFDMWPHRKLIEYLADRFLEEDDLPIPPYMTSLVATIVRHFKHFSTEATSPYMISLVERIVGRFKRLPTEATLLTEREIIDWIAKEGGIPMLLLRGVPYRLGPGPW